MICSRSNIGQDKYTFEDIFSTRDWAQTPRPATVNYVVKVNHNLRKGIDSSNRTASHCSKLFQMTTLFERLPLSNEGFAKLSADYRKYDQ